jgi:acyl-CoA synthetase (AMP-forming)/AMP-acid ligase II
MPNSLPQFLLASARERPGEPLLVCGGETHSRADVASAVLRIAGWFRRAGLPDEARVVLLLGNQPEFVPAWLGATLAGAAVVPLDPASSDEELIRRLDEIQPHAVLARPSVLHKIQMGLRNLPSLRTVVVTGAASPGATRWSALLEGPPVNVVRPAPRGGLAAAASAMAKLLALAAHDRMMIVLPLSSANAQFSVAMAIASGGSLLIERSFSPSSFWSAATKGGATQVSLSGEQLARLHARPQRRADGHHAIRTVVATGTPTEIHEAFEHRFGLRVVEAYGAGDAAFITVNPVERGRRKLGTVGLSVPWCDVAVLDEQLRPLPPGAIGRICVRSGEEGWLHAGALGTIDEEGFFTVVGQGAKG